MVPVIRRTPRSNRDTERQPDGDALEVRALLAGAQTSVERRTSFRSISHPRGRYPINMYLRVAAPVQRFS